MCLVIASDLSDCVWTGQACCDWNSWRVQQSPWDRVQVSLADCLARCADASMLINTRPCLSDIHRDGHATESSQVSASGHSIKPITVMFSICLHLSSSSGIREHVAIQQTLRRQAMGFRQPSFRPCACDVQLQQRAVGTTVLEPYTWVICSSRMCVCCWNLRHL